MSIASIFVRACQLPATFIMTHRRMHAKEDTSFEIIEIQCDYSQMGHASFSTIFWMCNFISVNENIEFDMRWIASVTFFCLSKNNNRRKRRIDNFIVPFIKT